MSVQRLAGRLDVPVLRRGPDTGAVLDSFGHLAGLEDAWDGRAPGR